MSSTVMWSTSCTISDLLGKGNPILGSAILDFPCQIKQTLDSRRPNNCMLETLSNTMRSRGDGGHSQNFFSNIISVQ